MLSAPVTHHCNTREDKTGAEGAQLAVDLDGARIFDAAVALGVDVKAITRGFDGNVLLVEGAARAGSVYADGLGGVDGAGAAL